MTRIGCIRSSVRFMAQECWGREPTDAEVSEVEAHMRDHPLPREMDCFKAAFIAVSERHGHELA